jgi:hypothetical protein
MTMRERAPAGGRKSTRRCRATTESELRADDRLKSGDVLLRRLSEANGDSRALDKVARLPRSLLWPISPLCIDAPVGIRALPDGERVGRSASCTARRLSKSRRPGVTVESVRASRQHQAIADDGLPAPRQ